jgi:hypothetical protein
MLRGCLPLLVAAGAVASCADREPSQATLQQASPVAAAAERLALDPATDALELDPEPASERALAAVSTGRDGGGAVWLLGPGRAATKLLDLRADESVASPRWSPDAARFAYVVSSPPERRMLDGEPALHWRGALWVGAPDGTRRLAVSWPDAARVLGWLDARTLVATRFLPGDMPQQRAFVLDVQTGAARQATGSSAHETQLGFALTGDRLYHVRSDSPVVTLPAPWQRLDVVETRIGSGAQRVVASEIGRMPVGLRGDGLKLTYALEGREGEQRLVDLASGEVRTMPGPGPSPDLSGVAAPIVRALSMPYIHQVYDTPDEFNGNWACGPTSTVMGVCHFGRLQKWPITVNTPSPHNSDYGAYVSRKYTAYGTTFDRMQTDASGKAAWGAYGWCTEGGGAWAWRMQDYAKKHDLKSDFEGSPTLAKVKSAIDAGKAVALSTQLTSAGHIIAVKGYTAADKMIVNDPYGDKNKGYMNYPGGERRVHVGTGLLEVVHHGLRRRTEVQGIDRVEGLPGHHGRGQQGRGLGDLQERRDRGLGHEHDAGHDRAARSQQPVPHAGRVGERAPSRKGRGGHGAGIQREDHLHADRSQGLCADRVHGALQPRPGGSRLVFRPGAGRPRGQGPRGEDSGHARTRDVRRRGPGGGRRGRRLGLGRPRGFRGLGRQGRGSGRRDGRRTGRRRIRGALLRWGSRGLAAERAG